MLRITDDRHAGTRHFAPLFGYDHLNNGKMRTISMECALMAQQMIDGLPDGPELTTGLRKLLEAKDCFVRAALAP
jgi:hypothetical protein